MTTTFAEFAASSPHTDAVERKKLLFVYRAIEDFAAEQGVSTSDLRVLEVGSGAGGVTLPLARLGARVRAIDVDVSAVAKLREAAGRFANLDVRVDDALAFQSNDRFDVMVVSEVLDHVREPERLLENMVRHMEPHGLLIVTTPNRFGMRRSSPAQLERKFVAGGLAVHRFMNSGFLLSRSKHMRRNETLGSFDAEFANLVPHWMASGWYIALRRGQ